jgi:hypothetical protein
MTDEAMLDQAQEMIDNAIRGDTATGTFYTLQGIGYALIAIGRLLSERLPEQSELSAGVVVENLGAGWRIERTDS